MAALSCFQTYSPGAGLQVQCTYHFVLLVHQNAYVAFGHSCALKFPPLSYYFFNSKLPKYPHLDTPWANTLKQTIHVNEQKENFCGGGQHKGLCQVPFSGSKF